MQPISRYRRELGFAWHHALGFRSKIVLLMQTIRFHARKYMPNTNETFEFNFGLTHGNVILNLRPFSGDLFVFYEVMMDCCYEIPDSVVRNPKTILDCGGNVGLSATYLADRYPNAIIYTVEPDAANFALLRKNTQNNPRILPIRAAIVGSPQATVTFSTKREAWGNFITNDGSGESVPSLTIDEIAANNQINRIDLLKMDIEGGEIDVFRLPDFLNKVGALTIELHDSQFAMTFPSLLEKYNMCVRSKSDDGLMIVATKHDQQG